MSSVSFTIDKDTEKKDLEIPEYSLLSLKLEGNPSTGFGWYLENQDALLKSNIKPLNLTEHLTVEFTNPDQNNKLLGQSGFFDFKFKLLPGAENSEIKFVYKRFNVTENSRPLTVNIKINELKVNNIKKLEKNLTATELELKEGEINSIQIPGNATTGFLWFVDNVDELNKAGIEIINLGEHNTGKYITQKPKEGEPMMVGAPGVFEFVIKADKYPNGEMPKIKLVNKRMNDKEGKELLITLKKCCCNKNKNKIRFTHNGGKGDLEVEKNSEFNVELEGNPTTGYSWILENVDSIKNSKLLTILNLEEEMNTTKTYVQDPCKDGMCGVGGTFIFGFKVNEVNEKDELPQLIFGYKRPWEKDVKDYKKVELNLKLKKQCESNIPFVCLKQEGGNAELKVENNKEFKIALEGNPTTGYCWYLKNAEEIKKCGLIELLNLDEYCSVDFVQKENEQGLVGVGGVFCFKFKVNNSEGKELPKLNFEYKRAWEKEKPGIGNAEITLKL